MGTVAYMSPEQAEGKAVDARTDIFSFGSMLYKRVPGQRAFQDDSPLSTVTSVLRGEPKPVSQLREGAPAELSRYRPRSVHAIQKRVAPAAPTSHVCLNEGVDLRRRQEKSKHV